MQTVLISAMEREAKTNSCNKAGIIAISSWCTRFTQLVSSVSVAYLVNNTILSQLRSYSYV